jgi:hypothetical protein
LATGGLSLEDCQNHCPARLFSEIILPEQHSAVLLLNILGYPGNMP